LLVVDADSYVVGVDWKNNFGSRRTKPSAISIAGFATVHARFELLVRSVPQPVKISSRQELFRGAPAPVATLGQEQFVARIEEPEFEAA
jgi:hypothetical protein